MFSSRSPAPRQDGLAFVAQAVENGADGDRRRARAARLCRPASALIVVADARAALWRMPRRGFYPRQPATIVAVTGTSGKTSVAAFARQIWARLGLEAASLGTIGIVSREMNVYGSLTTPDPIALHASLDELAARRRHASGAGSLFAWPRPEAARRRAPRRRRLHQSVARSSRLSRDAAKPISPPSCACSASFWRPARRRSIDARQRCRRRGRRRGRAARAEGLHHRRQGRGDPPRRRPRAKALRRGLTLEHAGRQWRVLLPLPGDFQVSNALVAAGLCIATGSDAGAVFAALETLQGAPGRLERIGERHGAPVFVDYAHKPDALDKALATLRPFVRGRLDRRIRLRRRSRRGQAPDHGRDRRARRRCRHRHRRQSAFGKPRRHSRRHSRRGARRHRDRRSRARRSATAVAMLGGGDALLIAGKGHETGQIVGNSTLPFSDHEAARAALKDAA